ncbi:MAG: EAL domain-containing protein, partial [Eggerthellaceae bacterium]
LYVWEEACRHIRSWIDRGGVPIPVSVNISRADLYAIDVVEALEGLVSRYDLDHRLLELEITESAYAEDEKMADAVARLKGLGFTILMDDFGSGYSSLNMLKDITVDILKIDMGFLARQDQSQRSESILEAIVSMARFMDLRIIAEGAETKEQVDFLQGIGCDYAGYYFYRPMSTEALDAAVAGRRGLPRRVEPQIYRRERAAARRHGNRCCKQPDRRQRVRVYADRFSCCK